MNIITIPKKITGKEELVIISRKELERMKAQMMPVTYLKGKAARKLDQRVERGLKEYREGKTRKISSLVDLE